VKLKLSADTQSLMIPKGNSLKIPTESGSLLPKMEKQYAKISVLEEKTHCIMKFYPG
jgi:hypothetical protein